MGFSDPFACPIPYLKARRTENTAQKGRRGFQNPPKKNLHKIAPLQGKVKYNLIWF